MMAESFPVSFLGQSDKQKQPADVARQLKARHLTHLLVRDELLIRFLRDNLDPAQQRLWANFTANHLKSLFRDRGYSVLQLHG